MQVLDMCVYDVLLHLLRSPLLKTRGDFRGRGPEVLNMACGMYSCTFELTAKTCLQVSNATGQEAPEDDQEVPGDTVMNDTESESEVEEISTGGKFALFMTQACLSFFEIQDHLF